MANFRFGTGRFGYDWFGILTGALSVLVNYIKSLFTDKTIESAMTVKSIYSVMTVKDISDVTYQKSCVSVMPEREVVAIP